MGKTLFQKVWDRHTVGILPDGLTQLFVGTHLIHEVTSPQAFGMLRDLGLKVAFPQRTFATVDHIVPTDQRTEPFRDSLADAMIKELRKNCSQFGVTFLISPQGNRASFILSDPNRALPSLARRLLAGILTPRRMEHLARSPSESARAKSETSSLPRPWPFLHSRFVKLKSAAN